MVDLIGYINLILSSLFIAGLSLFIQEGFKSPMIFRRYYLFLVYHWKKNWRKKDRWKRKALLLQPLGLCVWCSSIWIATGYYLYKYGLNVEILLYFGMVYLWIKFALEVLKFNIRK